MTGIPPTKTLYSSRRGRRALLRRCFSPACREKKKRRSAGLVNLTEAMRAKWKKKRMRRLKRKRRKMRQRSK